MGFEQIPKMKLRDYGAFWRNAAANLGMRSLKAQPKTYADSNDFVKRSIHDGS